MIKELIQCAELEMKNHNSIWDVSIIENTILPEMRELLKYAQKGEILFKNNHLQGRLDSFLVLESNENLKATSLGSKIVAFQKTYHTFPVMYLNKRSV